MDEVRRTTLALSAMTMRGKEGGAQSCCATLECVATGYKNCRWVAMATAWARVSTPSLLKIDWM